MAPLAGKHVLIIGGSSGIGFGVSRSALREGARVTIASSDEKKVRAAAERLGGGDSVRTEVIDVREESQIKALFEKVGPIDHFVITAGEMPFNNDLINIDLPSLKAFLDIRYYGALMCARHAKGHILESFTITSGTIGVRAPPGTSNIAGGVAAIIHSARALALDLKPLRVNCITPGLVDSEMWHSIPKEARDAQFQQMIDNQIVPHAGTPDEIAEAYLFAMKCSYLTGQSIVVDGGATIA